MVNNIAVIGSTTIDKIIHRDCSRFKIGGVTTYAGITYSRHGIKTRVVTNIANRNSEIIKRLQAEQIVVCNGQTPETTHFVNYINDNTQRQKITRRAALISSSQVREHVKEASIVHLGPLHASDIDIGAVRLLKNFKLFVVLDAQGYTRSVKNKSVHPIVSKQLLTAFRNSDIVKANQGEFEIIIDFCQMDLEVLMNQFNISEFVVTSGDKGGFVQKISGEKIRYRAARIGSMEDPTGTGDIFLAAYVIGRLLNGQSIPAACKYAAQLAARQIEGNYIKPGDLGLDDSIEL